MKRIVLRVLFFLLLGAVTSVAVAWSIACWSNPFPFSERLRIEKAPPASNSSVQELRVVRCQSWGILWVSVHAYNERQSDFLDFEITDEPLDVLLAPWSVAQIYPPLADPALWPSSNGAGAHTGREMVFVSAHGWPLHCLWGGARYDGSTPPAGYRVAGSLTIPHLRSRFFEYRQGSPVWLPCCPIWMALLADSALYAAPWWLAFCVPPIVRGVWRRRHNLCLHCAYPIGTSHVCSECGKPVNSRAGAAA